MKTIKKIKVSIVMPVFNAEKYIASSFASISRQTFASWELIAVDDASTDNSLAMLEDISARDKRVMVIAHTKNRGVAAARNTAIKAATGDYIAFIDADDIWRISKLEKQLSSMTKRGSTFSFTNYEFGDSDGIPNGTVVLVPEQVSLNYYLKNNIIWTSTVMLDMNYISKDDVYMKDLSYGEDALCWIGLLLRYGDAHGLQESLSIYRRVSSSLSANKFKIVYKKFRLYMSIDQINLFQKVYYYARSLYAAAQKRTNYESH